MSATLFLGGKAQLFDDAGAVLAGGKVYFYRVGTSTPKDTYTSAALTTPNPNPVILDAAGRADIWLSGDYRVVVDTSSDVNVYTAENVNPGIGVQNGSGSHGSGRFNYLSNTTCVFDTYQGNTVLVKTGGVWEARIIPPTGISVTNAGLVADTLYYAYLYDNAGQLAIEFSATGYSPDNETGVEVLSSDSTRTLIGLVQTTSASQFAFASNARLVASWFNRLEFPLEATDGGTDTITSATPQEIGTGKRVELVTWKSQGATVAYTGSYQTNFTPPQAVIVSIGFDTAATFSGTQSQTTADVNGQFYPFSAAYSPDLSLLTEGYHYFAPVGSTAQGTMTLGTGSRITGSGMF